MTLQLHRGDLRFDTPGVLIIPGEPGDPYGVVNWPEGWPALRIASFAAEILDAVIGLTYCTRRRRGALHFGQDGLLEVPADCGVPVAHIDAVGIGLCHQGCPLALDGPLACALVVEIGNALLAGGVDPDRAVTWPPMAVDLTDMFERHEAGRPPLPTAPKARPPAAPDPRQMVLM